MRSWEQYEAEAKADYLRWKANQHVTNVEINVETTGISAEDIAKIDLCFQLSRSFALYSMDGYAIIEPLGLVIFHEGVVTEYVSLKQLQNALKLMLFTYNKVHVPVKQIR